MHTVYSIWSYQVLPLQARVDPGTMAIKKYSTIPKSPQSPNLTIRWFNVISRTLVGGWVVFTPLQRCSQCILQPQPTGLYIFCVFVPFLFICCFLNRSIQVRRTRHAGHCWRSRDELIRDILLWIPTHGCAKAGRPARTYIQQLCEDTGCCPEDLPRAMNDREEWRERVRDIRAASTIWWWWWWFDP